MVYFSFAIRKNFLSNNIKKQAFNLQDILPYKKYYCKNTKIWKILNPDKKFKYISEKPYKYDVQRRIPSVNKAKKILNFSADTSLESILEEVIPWVKQMVKEKKI